MNNEINKKFIEKNNITDEEFEVISKFIMLRMSKNISQRKLSELTGIAQSTIARIEKNVTTASLSTFTRLLKALDCHIEIVKNK